MWRKRVFNSIHLLHSDHGMVYDRGTHKTYLHINNYRGQTDRRFGKQTTLLIFMINKHSFLRDTGSLVDMSSNIF
jgi:hypothetical protein